ncbi:MAG: TatD family hydrolase [archaeon]|nr:TatD family hydrolase [archaeon]
MRFADTHLHMTEKSVSYGYPDLGEAELLFSCSAQREDWGPLKDLTIPNIVRFYGIHPGYADQWNTSTRDALSAIISEDPDARIGEIGLDGKHDAMDRQLAAFTEQVVMASRHCRTINVHDIGCEGDILKILKKYGKGCRSIILHSFKGVSVRQYEGLECYFSINPRILGKSEEHIRDIVGAIPLDRLVLESDAPFTSREFVSMGSFIDRLSQIMGMPAGELAETALRNARRSVQ